MLEIDNTNNTIYLTKGDSGVINISLNGDTTGYSDLHFYVRSATQQDNVKIHISNNNSFLGQDEAPVGTINGSGANWSLHIDPAATEELKRGKYVYDFKLTGDGVVTTFVGGGKDKVEFWVT